MAIYDRICRTCGKSFKGGPRAWYCPDCREERQKEREAKYRRGEPKRHLGSIDKCLICGKEYTVESGLQKYCPDCQPEMHRKIDNEQGIAYYHHVISKDLNLRNQKRKKHYEENKDEINQKRRENHIHEETETNINLRELRGKTRMTQKEFAHYFGIPLSTYIMWETGKKKVKPYIAELIVYKLKNEGLI